MSKVNDIYKVLTKKLREAISVDSFNNEQLPSKESRKEITVTSTIIIKDIFKIKSKGNTIMQEVHMGNPIFHSQIKGSDVTYNLHRTIHENFDVIDSNVAMIIKDDKEGNKIIARNLNYNPMEVRETCFCLQQPP